MFETGTLIARANTLFGEADRLADSCYNESKATHIAACLADLKKDIEAERAHLYLAVDHVLLEKEKGYIPYPNLSNEDLIRSICVLDGLLSLIELSKAAVKGELKAYKVVYLPYGGEYEMYTGYSLEEARKVAKNDTYEIRIYKPWKPIELMDGDDLAELFDDDEQIVTAKYEIYKEGAKA